HRLPITAPVSSTPSTTSTASSFNYFNFSSLLNAPLLRFTQVYGHVRTQAGSKNWIAGYGVRLIIHFCFHYEFAIAEIGIGIDENDRSREDLLFLRQLEARGLRSIGIG